MSNPYEILGVNENATDDEIKIKYRELVKKYHPDKYQNNPLSELAEEKLREVNEAYDEIQNLRKSGSRSRSGYGNSSKTSPEFQNVRRAIDQNRVDEAERLLDNIGMKNAEWYFLKGMILYKKGWYDDAIRNIQMAVNMEPNDMEYRNALNQMTMSGGGFRNTAISGLFMAIGLGLIYGGSVISNLALTFYGIAGFLIGMIIVEKDIKAGVVLYMGTSILALALVPNKIALIPYITVFGTYGFVKLLIEKIHNGLFQLGCKIIFFLVVGYITLFIYREIFFSNIKLPGYSNYILLLGGVITGVIYDYLYTLALYFYRGRIRREEIDIKLIGDKDGDEKR